MAKAEVKRTYKIPGGMDEYIKTLSRLLRVSENDVIKMIIFDSMNKTKLSTIKEVIK